MDDLPLLAESLAVAGHCAKAMATELGATNFYIASKPDKQAQGVSADQIGSAQRG